MKKSVLLLGIVTFLISCGGLQKEIGMKNFIDSYNSRVQPVFKKMALASWDASVTGNPDKYKESSDAEMELAQIHGNPDDFKKIAGDSRE